MTDDFYQGFTQGDFFAPWSKKILPEPQLLNKLVKNSADTPSVDLSTIWRR